MKSPVLSKSGFNKMGWLDVPKVCFCSRVLVIYFNFYKFTEYFLSFLVTNQYHALQSREIHPCIIISPLTNPIMFFCFLFARAFIGCREAGDSTS